MKEKRYVRSRWKSIEDKLFNDSAKEVDGFFRKLWLQVRQTLAVIFDSLVETKVISHSASMTYFTLVVSVPFVVLVLLCTNDWVLLRDSLDAVIDYIFKSGVYERIEESAISSIQYEKGKYGLISVVILMTVLCIRGFFIGLQRELNKTWGCNDREFPWADIFGAIVVFATLIGIALSGLALSKLYGRPIAATIALLAIVWLWLWGAYYFIPNSRKVGAVPSLIASAMCSVLEVLSWRILPNMALRSEKYSSLAILFMVLFVVFLSWFIFFLFADICSVWDRSNDKYQKRAIERMSPFFRDILTVYTVAYVFRTFSYCYRPVTLDQIRRGMFRSKLLQDGKSFDPSVIGKRIRKSPYKDIYSTVDGRFACVYEDEFGNKRFIVSDTLEGAEKTAASCIATGKAYLPVSVLNDILNFLVRQDILDYKDQIWLGKSFRCFSPKGNEQGNTGNLPRLDPQKATIGDIFFHLRMAGAHSLKYNYNSEPYNLTEILNESELKFLSSLKYPLRDVVFQIDMQKIDKRDNTVSAEESYWLNYTLMANKELDINHLKKYVRQSVVLLGKEAYLNQIMELEDDSPLLNNISKEDFIKLVECCSQ